MNQQYRELVLTRIKNAIEQSNACKNIKHTAIKGQLREIFIRELLQPFLPRNVEIGTGKVISSDNKESLQQDIILYDKRILPPILFESLGFFPVESVISTIEVKSKLTSTQLKQAHKNATSLLKLKHLPVEYDELNRPIFRPGSIKWTNPYLFAFDSDLSERWKTEVDRYDEILKGKDPSIRMLCVVNKGCWFFSPVHRQWLSVVMKNPHDEIMGFLIIFLNTYPLIAESRGMPRLGSYLS